ncbi:GNAT family N-acetyltransferase [Bordetella genomosp. 1]|uniref:GNAT family N-acetyltransferase n=1 Tax=Bordetella genomosp. 1 TaxID=1395607 RepID=A0A261SE84_9BORD|nr:GNAT family N-acetyltransferase [Bordetella genomosp. 1]MDQ8030908.1 GNAT family N-acetyltransferase [Bordetella sp.]OZI35676.1 GNAT family N-acetyltransferase [Bordetella genomosp. 1]
MSFSLTTPRLLLRPWRDADLPAFAELNADPRVMAFFPGTLDRAGSDALAARIRANLAQEGFGLWAVEVRGGAPFIGFVGLSRPRFDAPFTPCVEVGWRLAQPFWGLGFATEAARAALEHGFDSVGLAEIVAFTTAANRRSRAVMARLGMRHDAREDFLHPQLAPRHPLAPHVLYRLRAADLSLPAARE